MAKETQSTYKGRNNRDQSRNLWNKKQNQCRENQQGLKLVFWKDQRNCNNNHVDQQICSNTEQDKKERI